MQDKYEQIAPLYKEMRKLKRRAYRYLGEYTFFQVIGDITGKAILDFGCGEGTHARTFKQMGAKRVVGVDISQKMLELAKEEEAKEPLGIEYIHGDLHELRELGSFDLSVSFSVLSTIPTKEQLLKVCQAIYTNLKPQGRYVTVGINPDLSPDILELGMAEGFSNVKVETLQEGAIIIVQTLEEKEYRFEDYLLGREIYEWAFRTAGFKKICWHPVKTDIEGVQRFSKEVLQPYIDHQILFCLECLK